MASPASPPRPARAWRAALRRHRDAALTRALHRTWRAVQQAGAITPGSPAASRFAAFGPGSLITFPPGSLFGEEWIEIGTGTLVGAQVSISAGMMPGHDLGADPVLTLGDRFMEMRNDIINDRCVIGRGSHIVAHHSIVIGDDVYTGPYVYITDQNHSYADPNLPIGRQWPVNDAVSIGAGSWLGAGAIILPGARIGRNVVVAAGSVVRGEVPDRCVVAGVPARVVREFQEPAGWSRPVSGQSSEL